jgi:uncharacterized protein (TIGR03000 family)
VQPANDTVRVTVRVPNPNAQVWVEGALTTQRGTLREFESPQLKPGNPYTYNIRAQWQQDGKTVTRDRNVSVRPGSTFNVDFN